MTVDSDWDGLGARLVQLQEAVAAEIGAYPAPIPACDAQYNHLLERRAALAEALAELDAARQSGAGTAAEFRAATRVLAEDRDAGE
jgi:chorismate mutase